HPVYPLLFLGELLLLISPLIDSILGKAGIHLKLLRFVSYFSLMNLALLQGFWRFINGIQSNIWTPTKRNL
ncbi:MAG: glycosyl transferase family 2, partial [Bacteroidia bacterium]|nr:glycosyl transferase family 2 [Bacteroidia bacterium]